MHTCLEVLFFFSLKSVGWIPRTTSERKIPRGGGERRACTSLWTASLASCASRLRRLNTRANSQREKEMYIWGSYGHKLICPSPLPRDDRLRGDAPPKLLIYGVCGWEPHGTALRFQNRNSCGSREQMCAGAVFWAEDGIGSKGNEHRWDSDSASLPAIPTFPCFAVNKDKQTPCFPFCSSRMCGCVSAGLSVLIFYLWFRNVP